MFTTNTMLWLIMMNIFDGSKRHSIQAVERSQTDVQIVSNLPAPSNGSPIYRFLGASRPCGPAAWLALLLTKAGGIETNPGPTTSHKPVCICDLCYKQIHVRKQISIRCNSNDTGYTDAQLSAKNNT